MNYLEKAKLALEKARRQAKDARGEGGTAPAPGNDINDRDDQSPPPPWNDGDLVGLTRVTERDLHLPAGSLTLYDPPRHCPGCSWCRPPCSSAN